MKILLSNIITIKEPTKEVLDYFKNKLTYANPQYARVRAMGYSAYKVPKDIKLYNLYEGNLYIPMGCFEDLWKLHPVLSDYVDYCVSKPIKIENNIKLRDYQEPCVRAVKEYCNVILSMGCGMGKTLSCLGAIGEIKERTLWLAGTIDLIKQAENSCKTFMNCKTSFISEGKMDLSGDIVFGTVASVYKFVDNGELSQNEFGCVVLDECFPTGTKISTPNGYKNIEDIKIGDYVYSYNHDTNKVEIKKVDYLFNKDVDTLLTIKLSNGTIFSCTENHPIYCNDKYIRADELKVGDELYDMQSLWKRTKRERLYKGNVAIQDKTFRENGDSLLFQRMWAKIKCNKVRRTEQVGGMATKNERTQPNVQSIDKGKSSNLFANERRLETKSTWWKWDRVNKTSRNAIQRVEKNDRCNSRITDKNVPKNWKWIPTHIQSGFRDTFHKISNRNRRGNTSWFTTERNRQEKEQLSSRVRVESITIQKQSNIGKSTESARRIKVYNIGVEDNHNYFVSDILVHNCHHLSANPKSLQMVRTVFEYFPAKYRVGLSATIYRSDGLDKAIIDIIGKVKYNIVQKKQDYYCMYNDECLMTFPTSKFQVPCHVKAIDTNYTIDDRPVFMHNGGTINFAALISDIAHDVDRNNLILKDLYKMQGSTIVLSDRLDQLAFLYEKLDNAVLITGDMSKRQREKGLNDVRDGKVKYLLASYNLAKEGLDAPILENLVLATPIKAFSSVVQSIGRIQRPYKDKKVAYVYDYCDNVGMLLKFYVKRRAIYRKNGWVIDNMYLGGE